MRRKLSEIDTIRHEVAKLLGWHYHPWGNGGGGWSYLSPSDSLSDT